ncbi:recombinase family protein [Streptomyces sp. KM273126]|nr:recombinase family protein [Streptomyces sp. KM273126]
MDTLCNIFKAFSHPWDLLCVELLLRRFLVLLRVVDPLGDDGWVGSGFEGCLVAGKAPLAVLDSSKAATGQRIHKLQPDPVAAPIVQRIFTMYVDGISDNAVAAQLTRDAIPWGHVPYRDVAWLICRPVG